ncbi:MAG: hypothetical protein ACYDHY_07835 [Acidiferrobacterales bacterium]
MDISDHASIGALVGLILTIVKVVEKTIDHFVDKKKAKQPILLQLDPEASRLIGEVHAIVAKEDADGGRRIYVPIRTIEQVEQLHRHVVNGHIKE